MATEIEAKIRVDSHEQVIRKLRELNAEFVADLVQQDTFFDDSRASLLHEDKCLRLRTTLTGGTKKNYLTYKGPKAQDNLKKRREIETEIADKDALEALLAELGYKKTLAFEKHRQLWRLDRCEIALDRLPLLGNFVEIEGPNGEQIEQVQAKLGLAQLQHIPESYASLLTRKLKERGSGISI